MEEMEAIDYISPKNNIKYITKQDLELKEKLSHLFKR